MPIVVVVRVTGRDIKAMWGSKKSRGVPYRRAAENGEGNIIRNNVVY